MYLSVPRSAELAHLEMCAHWNHRTGSPIVAPGSSEESVALSNIDYLRELDAAGMQPTHPDSERGLGRGPYYRRGATPAHLESRRVASTRYWRRHTP